MEKIFMLLFSLTFLLGNDLNAQEDFRKKAPAAGPAPRIELGKAETLTFKNGLKVIVVENHKLPRLTLQLFVDYPPVLEGDMAGYVGLAGDLLSRGTTTRSKADIDQAVDFMGATLTTGPSGVTISGLSKHRDKMLEIFTDVIFNPTFPATEFEKLKTQALSALAQSKDDPNEIAANVSARLRNGKKHPYGEVLTEATINKITAEKCKAFYDTYFHPNISFLVITGDIDAQEAMKIASRSFSNWEKATVPPSAFDIPRGPALSQVDFVNKPGAVQSVINITYPVVMRPGAPDAIKSSVMNTLLGGFFSSRLNANLREDKAYTYGARSALETDPIIGHFNANASVRNEVTDSSLVQFLAEIKRLQTEEVGDVELNMVKNVMTGNFARSLESPATMARYQLNIARYHLPGDYYATYLEKLSQVSKEDIQQMAQQYLQPDNAHILVVGNKDEVADKLKVFSPEAKINFYDVYGEYLDDAGLELPAGMTVETILQDYLTAIGGKAAIENIKNVIIDSEADLQGFKMEGTLYHMAPNKLASSSKMMGNVIQSSVFDGTKGVNMQMGAVTSMEGAELQDMIIDSRLFPERFFAEMGVKTELKSVELVNGRKAYKVIATYPSGTKKTLYYDMETSLKVRELEPNGEGTVTKDLSDYKVVNGVKFPNVMEISGAAPVVIKLVYTSVEVNGPIDAGVFEIE